MYNIYNIFIREGTAMNRSQARENAFLLLFEGASNPDKAPNEVIEGAIEYRNIKCDDYVRGVFFGVYENMGVISEEIDKNLVGWSRARVSKVSMALLKLAIYEMLFVSDVPTMVAINEAVKLSKKYDDDKAYKFVNGVLNAAAEELGKK